MGQPHAERRLAAILAADVAGYSRLMGANQEGPLVQLKVYRRGRVAPKIHIVKATGDGMLVEFASLVDAVRCAVEIERGMAERKARISKNGARSAAVPRRLSGNKNVVAARWTPSREMAIGPSQKNSS